MSYLFHTAITTVLVFGVLLDSILERKEMDKEEFAKQMAGIFHSSYVEEEAHRTADDLMVSVLKDLGYDCSLFENADLWYA